LTIALLYQQKEQTLAFFLYGAIGRFVSNYPQTKLTWKKEGIELRSSLKNKEK
jgi:hypothetical protein